MLRTHNNDAFKGELGRNPVAGMLRAHRHSKQARDLCVARTGANGRAGTSVGTSARRAKREPGGERPQIGSGSGTGRLARTIRSATAPTASVVAIAAGNATANPYGTSSARSAQ